MAKFVYNTILSPDYPNWDMASVAASMQAGRDINVRYDKAGRPCGLIDRHPNRKARVRAC